MNALFARLAAILCAVALLGAALPAQSVAAQSEGIDVHGAWTIDVLDPDGTLVSHQTFENALTFQGGNLLALLLSRTQTLKLWAVTFENKVNYNQQTPCGNTECWLIEPASGYAAGAPYFKNLTVSVGSYPNIQPLVLTGSVTAPNAGQITSVGSWMYTCPTSGACYEGYADFTQRTLDTPVTVEAGQQVQVTVKISFS